MEESWLARHLVRPPRDRKKTSKFIPFFLTNSLRIRSKGFPKIFIYFEKIDFEGGPRKPKKLKSVFCENFNNFLLRPARELDYSLRYFGLKLLTRNNQRRDCTIKNDLKVTNNSFYGHEKLATCRKSNFPPWIFNKSITKFKLSKITSKTAYIDVLIWYPRRLWMPQLFFDVYTKTTFL